MATRDCLGGALLSMLVWLSSQAAADGEINGGHCYNGWHLENGRCHRPHGGEAQVPRFIKNGGKCYNGWYLDRKSGKCQQSLGWFESEDDLIDQSKVAR